MLHVIGQCWRKAMPESGDIEEIALAGRLPLAGTMTPSYAKFRAQWRLGFDPPRLIQQRTSGVSGTVGGSRTSDLRSHNPAL